jgi:hypothetical protein
VGSPPDAAEHHLCGCSFKAEKNSGRMPSMTIRAVCELAKSLGMKRSLSVSDVSPRSSQGGVHEI